MTISFKNDLPHPNPNPSPSPDPSLHPDPCTGIETVKTLSAPQPAALGAQQGEGGVTYVASDEPRPGSVESVDSVADVWALS